MEERSFPVRHWQVRPDFPRRLAVTMGVLGALQVLWFVPLVGLKSCDLATILPWVEESRPKSWLDPLVVTVSARVLSVGISGLIYFPAALAIVVLARAGIPRIRARMLGGGWPLVETWAGRVMIVLTFGLSFWFLDFLRQGTRNDLLADSSLSGFLFPNAVAITAATACCLFGARLVSRFGASDGTLLVLSPVVLGSLARSALRFRERVLTGEAAMEQAVVAAAMVLVVVALTGALASAELRIRIARPGGAKKGPGLPPAIRIALCPAGVWPLLLAVEVGNFLPRCFRLVGLSEVAWFLSPGENARLALELAFVVVFALLTARAAFEPESISAALKSKGAFLPGTRPGSATAARLARRAARAHLAGAALLMILGLATAAAGRALNGLAGRTSWPMRADLCIVPAALWGIVFAIRVRPHAATSLSRSA